jgi:hypothetical protein
MEFPKKGLKNTKMYRHITKNMRMIVLNRLNLGEDTTWIATAYFYSSSSFSFEN